ncbi:MULTISPECIES: hypothetical protein [Staphylococcus]|uniref:hypothetical protein n=1 Tax=Staphylococcus TaxID=1279 RepID=UPI0007CA6FA9|nr:MULTISPECIES: hypothetical protein [Staphylococcus]MDW4108234.1 hypothetical protein [Staphylococcus saprophyticus]MBF2179334.1 hypothetical protein [Staphylococcus warneri]MBF2186238.1 hypothetical protein [Staphylococcus warneri]MDV0014254.1 hypothetical protein [Staphylococcus aureus]MDV0019755.1 hypothetical protein [Staphylococcus aureus]
MTDVKHKLPETERKTKMIVFRVREDEYDRLKTLSDELKGYKSPNEIARLITLEWLDNKQTFKPKQTFDNVTFEVMKDLRVLASELRNDIQGVARNFNQYIKLLNTRKLRNELSVDDLKNIDEFRQQFRTTRKNIGNFNREVGLLSRRSK